MNFDSQKEYVAYRATFVMDVRDGHVDENAVSNDIRIGTSDDFIGGEDVENENFHGSAQDMVDQEEQEYEGYSTYRDVGNILQLKFVLIVTMVPNPILSTRNNTSIVITSVIIFKYYDDP